MKTVTLIEIRCPVCGRFCGKREAGTMYIGYCRDCRMTWEKRT